MGNRQTVTRSALNTCQTITGVVGHNFTCHRHHPEHGCGEQDAATPPSTAVASAGRGEDLVKRGHRGTEPFLVFAHAHDGLSAISYGRASGGFGPTPIVPEKSRLGVPARRIGGDREAPCSNDV